jgi:rhodanese-related sulfurtransferase
MLQICIKFSNQKLFIMKKIVLFLPLIVLTVFTTACNSQNSNAVTEHKGNPVLVENAKEGIHKNIAAAEFKQLVAKGDVVIVDVRTPNEYAQGHIQDAKLINLYERDFDAQIAKLNKETTTLVYCRSGRRSASAMRKMQSAGFSTVYNLSGGIMSWMRAGGELVK